MAAVTLEIRTQSDNPSGLDVTLCSGRALVESRNNPTPAEVMGWAVYAAALLYLQRSRGPAGDHYHPRGLSDIGRGKRVPGGELIGHSIPPTPVPVLGPISRVNYDDSELGVLVTLDMDPSGDVAGALAGALAGVPVVPRS